MKAVLVAGCLLAGLAACRGRNGAPVPRTKDAVTAVAPVDARAPQTPDPAWPPDAASLARSLAANAQQSILLVEESDAIVARTASGSDVRKVINGKVSRASYDPRVAVLWFLRGGRLEAIDLADATGTPVAIVDDMPDLPFLAGRGEDVAHPMCDACVTVSAVPPAVGVTAEAKASGGELQGKELERFERDRKIAANAHPRLSATAQQLLGRLGRREERSIQMLKLGDRPWPLPRSARSKVPCAGGCTHGFSLDKLGWQLVVTGRECDCLEDRCWATCVLYDPVAKKYATPSKPADFRSDAKPESACQPTLDATGTAYILDGQRVCTSTGCIMLNGRILGWVEPGMTTLPVPEDTSACPEGP